MHLEYDYRRDFEHYLGTLEACRIKRLQDILTPEDTYAALALPEGQLSPDRLHEKQIHQFLTFLTRPIRP